MFPLVTEQMSCGIYATVRYSRRANGELGRTTAPEWEPNVSPAGPRRSRSGVLRQSDRRAREAAKRIDFADLRNA